MTEDMRLGFCDKCDDMENPCFEYCEKHDAYFCKECDIWIEPRCSDLTCEYCNARPPKPSDVKS